MSALRHLICLWTFFFALVALADTTAELDLNASGQYAIGKNTLWLEDSNANLTPNDILKSSAWRKNSDSGFNFGFSHAAYWLKTDVQNNTDLEWSYWIRYSLLDTVDLWVCPQNPTNIDSCKHYQNGDQYPFEQHRPHDHPNLIFSLPFETNQAYTLLLRSQTTGTQLIPAYVIDSNSLKSELLTESLLRGAYYATMLVIGIYNLLIFAFTRDRSYLSYSAFVGVLLVFHMIYDGTAFQLLWPNAPEINQYALPIALTLTILTLSFFVPQFLNLNRKNSSVFRLFRAYIGIAVVCLLMQPLLSYEFLLESLNLLVFLITFTALITGVYFWIQGHKPARFFTIAWLALALGVLSSTLRSFGWGPTDLFTLYGYQMGSFLQVILMSLALAERIMQLQKDNLLARKELLDNQEASIQHLRDYEELYQNALSGQFQLDKEGYFIRSNTSWRAMLGYTERSYFTNDNPRFNSLFADSVQRKSIWKELKEQGRIRARVVTLIQPVTEERIMVSLTMRKGHNTDAAWYGSGTDVTDNYLKEQALIQQQIEKNKALRLLITGISNDMSASLSSIQDSEKALRDTDLNENREALREHFEHNLTQLHSSITRLDTLNELMQNSIVQTQLYPPEEIKLRNWLETWRTEELAKHKTLTLIVSVHSYVIDWETHPSALKFVLDQLLENSCEHNEKLYSKGELKISLEFRERGEFLELHYRDNGKGVPPDQRHSIFMPFYTTRGDNSKHKGLGLYQSYNLLTELMQGHLEWPTSHEGFYIIVRFHLPIADKKEDLE